MNKKIELLIKIEKRISRCETKIDILYPNSTLTPTEYYAKGELREELKFLKEILELVKNNSEEIDSEGGLIV